MKRKWGRAVAEQVAFGGLVTAGVPTYIAKPLVRSTRPRTMPSVGTQTDRRGYGSGTYTCGGKQYGRRISRKSSKYARLLANASVQRNVYGTDNYTTFGGVNGDQYLTNWNDTGSGVYRVPLHLWDVTAVPNSNAGAVNNAQAGYKLCFDATGTPTSYSWRAMGNAMSVRNIGLGPTSPNTYPCDASLLRGVKAKFMFYAPQGISTKITVSLVQIMDDKFHPPKSALGAVLDVGQSVANDTSLGSSTDVGGIAFWQAAVHKSAKNPVCIDNGNSLRNLKILKSSTFYMNPKETTDTTNTTLHQFDFYHKFARRVRYNWQDQNVIALMGNPDTVGDDSAAVNQNQCKCSPEPRARLYLMVTGVSKYNNEATFTAGYWPSYDICLRTYHDCQN